MVHHEESFFGHSSYLWLNLIGQRLCRNDNSTRCTASFQISKTPDSVIARRKVAQSKSRPIAKTVSNNKYTSAKQHDH